MSECKVPSFTALELQALRLALISSDPNGFDFGFVEDISDALTPQVARALVVSLQAKGAITLYAPVRTESGTWTQFTWDIPAEEIETLLVENGVAV